MDTRQLQINSLLQNVVNVKEKYNNNYEVFWYDPKINRTLCLNITLPPQFPTCAPVFKITPQLFHPWVDTNGYVVGHKKLGSGWNQHVSLANVTNEIIKELKTATGGNLSPPPPPPPLQSYPGIPRMSMSGTPSFYQMPPPPPPNMMRPISFSSFQSLVRPTPNPTPTPSTINNNKNNNDNKININISDLDKMSIEELKEILNNESKRKEYINEKDKIKEMQNINEEMSLGNKSLAEKILSYKEKFENLKKELVEQQNKLKGEKEKFESLMREQSKYISNYTPTKLFSSLNQASTEADRNSEDIANDFLMGSISADEFLKKYRSARKSYHLRTEKMELYSHNHDSFFVKK